ncbi:flavin reductase [Bradyrhizobium sp. Ai1a-2]|uniref:flavin reductase n=1 Tax=Bradyrhizobium sp. Ai1a-2 TaxID=196490 RepID=UPI0004046013|nr:flavin reductase [Bradyrhizobium sp. Ai1a-2]
MSDIQSIDTIAFRQAMRNLASGVAIVATGAAAGQRGLTVSSVSSICMETPCLLVGMKANSEAHEAILAKVFLAWVFSAAIRRTSRSVWPAGMPQRMSTVSIQPGGIRASSDLGANYGPARARCFEEWRSFFLFRVIAAPEDPRVWTYSHDKAKEA